MKLVDTDLTAHKLVADTCVEFANELWEELCRTNQFYAANKQHYRLFIQRIAPVLRPHAVKTLSNMLGRDDITDSQKALIHEALLMDRSIPEGMATVVHR